MSKKSHCDICDVAFPHAGDYQGVFNVELNGKKIRVLLAVDVLIDGQGDVCSQCANDAVDIITTGRNTDGSARHNFIDGREEAAKPDSYDGSAGVPGPAGPKDVLGFMPPHPASVLVEPAVEMTAAEVFKRAKQTVRLGTRRMS